MGAASISETSVNFYQTTWHYNPEDSHPHTCHHKNLNSCSKDYEVYKHKVVHCFIWTQSSHELHITVYLHVRKRISIKEMFDSHVFIKKKL
jgi:hypothetical protein